MPRFEVIDHTADVGIVAYGSDMREAFSNAAHGMFSLIANTEGVQTDTARNVEIEAPDLEALLVAWLNELLYLFDVDRIIFSDFEIHELDETNLRATARGEKVDASRHHLGTGVKAATYHSLEIAKGDGIRIQVILDV
jgi:SHS2 domain-containing protein